MNRAIILLSAVAATVAVSGSPALAQSRRPQAAAPAVRPAPVAPTFRSVPHPVSPYGSNQPFPPPRFWSELVSKEFTRQALDGAYHTREVDLANAASVMIDRGDCARAENYLETMGAPDMAARVGPTCEAKRRGLL